MTTSTLPQRPATGSAKSEPDECSIDDAWPRPTPLCPGRRAHHQARNFMRDGMQVGDGVLFYHLQLPRAGHCWHRLAWPAGTRPPTQFDPTSLFRRPQIARRCALLAAAGCAGPAARRASSVWPSCAASAAIADAGAAKGSWLSITPVEPEEWAVVVSKVCRAIASLYVIPFVSFCKRKNNRTAQKANEM